MSKIDIIEIMKEFSKSNIAEMNLEYKKIKLNLKKNSNKDCLENQENNINQKWILAPLVGKISKVSVHEGELVKKGDSLCVIKAMKTFNEIKADDNYEVITTNIKNDDNVEFNQKMILVRKVND